MTFAGDRDAARSVALFDFVCFSVVSVGAFGCMEWLLLSAVLTYVGTDISIKMCNRVERVQQRIAAMYPKEEPPHVSHSLYI